MNAMPKSDIKNASAVEVAPRAPKLACFLNDADCVQRTREEVRKMAYEVWLYSMAGAYSGTKTEKQKLINEGMGRIIRTALGDYAKEIFSATIASLRVEMKDDNRIKDAYKKGFEKSMSPDSCIIPNYRGVGQDFVLMYKMNMSSISKNKENIYLNLSGEIFEFHRHAGNKERFLVMINATPTVCFRPVGKKGAIAPEKTRFEDHSERFVLDEDDVPGSLGHRIKTQTVIADLKFDWHPEVIDAMVSKTSLHAALQRLGLESVKLDGMDLSGIEHMVDAVIRSYDPLHEFADPEPLDLSAFPDDMGGDDYEYPF